MAACILSWLCIDSWPSLCLSFFLTETRQRFISNMQGYLTLHLYGGVCPVPQKSFTNFKGYVFSWYSGVMLTPPENLILSQFPFCLCMVSWHIVISKMHAKKKINKYKKQPYNNALCLWMTSLTSALTAVVAPASPFYRYSLLLQFYMSALKCAVWMSWN